MTHRWRHAVAVVVAGLGAFTVIPPEFLGSAPKNNASVAMKEADSADDAYLSQVGTVPLHFEANHGQTDPEVKFVSRGAGYTMFLASREAVLALGKDGQGGVVRMQLRGANAEPEVAAGDILPGKINYIRQDQSLTDIPTFTSVSYRSVYPGIDLLYYGKGREVEYDFTVFPEADPAAITLGFDGADDVTIDEAGDLVLRTRAGELRQRRPVVYQDIGGKRRRVPGDFVLRGGREVGFEVGPYDHSRPLVIDPTLAYSTYLGGTGYGDAGSDIVVDNNGSIYVAGNTTSTDFPVSTNSFDQNYGGSGLDDVFVAKIDPTKTGASSLVYATYLGGSGDDRASGIGVDPTGAAYVAGGTGSTDFPTSATAFKGSLTGGTDAFVTKLAPSGSALSYSTYLGGSGRDAASGMASDDLGTVYLTGGTGGGFSNDFATTAGAYDRTYAGAGYGGDAYMAKIDTTMTGATSLVYSTYLSAGPSGSSGARGTGIAIGPDGAVYVSGRIDGRGFPTTAGAFQETPGPGNIAGFVAKISPDADDPSGGDGDPDDLVYGTYLSGDSNVNDSRIAVDGSGSAYVTGATGEGFPTTSNALQPSPVPSATHHLDNGFMAKLDPAGSSLLYSTYLSGAYPDFGRDVAVDSAGNALVVGATVSSDFPITSDAIQSKLGGGLDVFMVKIDPTRSGSASLLFSSFLGGNKADEPFGAAADKAGNLYLTGATDSPERGRIASSRPLPFPTTDGAFQTEKAGRFTCLQDDHLDKCTFDAFVTKVSGL